MTSVSNPPSHGLATPAEPLTIHLSLENFDIWLQSYFIAGLVQLSQEGSVELQVTSGGGARWLETAKRPYPVLSFTCSKGNGAASRIICFDPKDQSDSFCLPALERCDAYFKRSMYPPDNEKLTSSQKVKIYPTNPIFATWPQGAAGWKMRLSASIAMRLCRQIAAGAPLRPAAKVASNDLRIFAFLSNLDGYEDCPATPKRRQVLFQTRLWDPAEEEGDWVEDCNRHRVEMVRVLRRRLGERCVGGLIQSQYTVKNYPELLSNLTVDAKAKRPEFIRLCREFLVRVNIKALFDAVPYSLGETLAANSCLVSENIRNTFAAPMIEGEHYAGFTTADECADRCLELLDSRDKASRLRDAAHAYYCEAVRPREAMRTFLRQAMA